MGRKPRGEKAETWAPLSLQISKALREKIGVWLRAEQMRALKAGGDPPSMNRAIAELISRAIDDGI
jgi:hypothetical protein